MLSRLLVACSAFGALEAVQISGERSAKIDIRGTGTKLKAFIINSHESQSMTQCMQNQVARIADRASKIGAHVSVEVVDNPKFETCTDVESCLKERPECFPTKTIGFVDMGFANHEAGKADKFRSALSSWCGKLNIFKALRETKNTGFDFFMMIEDDVLVKDDFIDKVLDFYSSYRYHWGLVGIDTEAHWLPELPREDIFVNTSSFQLYSMSSSMNAYWNGRVWLINAVRALDVAKVYETTPATSMNLFTKGPNRPSSLGMWSFQAGIVRKDALDEHGMDSTPECSEVDSLGINLITNDISDQRHREATPVQREIVVLGMPGAEAGIAMDLIKEGLEKKNNVSLCQHSTEDNECGPIRSHTHPALIEELEGDFSDAVAVVVVRHPLGTSHALKTNTPIMSCGNETYLNKLMQERSYWSPFSENFIASKPSLEEQDVSTYCWWQSTTEAWSSYATGYKNIGKRFHQVLVVRLEDVVAHPLTFLNQVAVAAGVPGPVSKLDQSEFVPRDYTDDFELPSCEDMYILCSNLDKASMFELGYHFCQKAWTAYDELMNNGAVYQDLVRPMETLMHSWPEGYPCKARGA